LFIAGKESTRIKNAFYNVLVEQGDDFEYHAVNSQPILMAPFDGQEPIRLIETMSPPQTANPKMKSSQQNAPPKSAVP